MDNEYQELHPKEVEEVHVLHDTDQLEKLVKEYQKLQRSLEDLIDDFTSKKRRDKKIKPKMVCCLLHWLTGSGAPSKQMHGSV